MVKRQMQPAESRILSHIRGWPTKIVSVRRRISYLQKHFLAINKLGELSVCQKIEYLEIPLTFFAFPRSPNNLIHRRSFKLLPKPLRAFLVHPNDFMKMSSGMRLYLLTLAAGGWRLWDVDVWMGCWRPWWYSAHARVPDGHESSYWISPQYSEEDS